MVNAATTEQIAAGQAVYNPFTLRAYDWFVLGLSSSFLWRCPARRMLDHYDRHVSANHLDVGVGTGYFLDKCRFPSPSPRVALMDLNPHSLAHAARRIARYNPETLTRNVLAPIAYEGKKFDSVGVSFLLHCLPGTMEEKAAAFDGLNGLMKPGAALFGATLLHDGVERSLPAAALMGFYNRKGIFSNRGDSPESLRQALESRFHAVSVKVVGCAALFSAVKA
jgi:hypothetical protein